MKMKTKLHSIINTAIILLLAGILACLPVSATQKQIDEVNDNINKLEKEQENSRQELEDLQNDKTYLSGQLSQLNSQLSALAQELTALADKQQQTEQDILSTEQELETARQEEEAQYSNMKKRIRYFYENGDESLLAVLLSASDFADFLNRSQYVESMYSYDRKMLEEFRQLKEDITARETRLKEDRQALTELANQQEEKLAKVKTLLAQVQGKIDQSNQQIADTKNDIADYEAQLEKQRAYEAELEKQKAIEDAKRLEEIKRQEEQLPPFSSSDENDIRMLAALIECEAGGESYEGKLAVGSVVVNRVRSSYFPNTLVEVIYQSGQFSPVASGRYATVLSRGASQECVRAATEVLAGNITLNCLYFRRNTGIIQGTVIGNHVFY